jgi:cytosine/adenosine deaminase-related metal-dependent hydrolase
LGFRKVGLLKAGWKADIAMLDISSPHWTPTYDPAAELVYAAQGSDVYLTMVDGNILYENGTFNTLDAEKTRKEALAASAMLLEKARI